MTDFRVTSLSSNLFQEFVSLSNDVQYRFGCSHLAYLPEFDIRLPAVLRPVYGATVSLVGRYSHDVR